jgi:hypothetical protein
MTGRNTEKDLETLRKLAVDLAKDGHPQARNALAVHDLIKELSEQKPTTEET